MLAYSACCVANGAFSGHTSQDIHDTLVLLEFYYMLL